MTRLVAIISAAVLFNCAAVSAQASCESVAKYKKLAGAALTSFMTKCESDARTTCERASQDKKLAGAAKTSFEKKCVSDATGAK